MKKIVLLLALGLAAAGVQGQEISTKQIREKAKREGITASEYPFFEAREKARAEGREPAVAHRKPIVYSNQLQKGNAMARTSTVSTCNNLDFANVSFANWNVFNAVNGNSALPPGTVTPDPIAMLGPNQIGGNNTILDSANSYVWSSTLTVPSNYADKNIARINHIGAGAVAGILERQITVTANQPYLNFSYAVLLENAGHTAADQPYLSITMFDSNNNPIPNASLTIVANVGSPNPGFTQVTFLNNNSYFYKPWTPVTINLSAYVGQAVTLQIIAADCVAGGHGGHAYVDFDCGGPTAGVANVWPGDANYDLTVDFQDLFYIGAGAGLPGPSRATQGNTWAALPSNNWNQNSLYLVDAKHADCDGNGTVGASDVAAIYQNYGLGHAFKSSGTYLVAEKTTAAQQVTILSSVDSVYAGQAFTLDFQIGNASPVDSIYAIGFNLSYPEQLLDNSLSNMSCGSSVISSTNYFNLFKQLPGSADLAITKNNQLNSQNVQGTVFSLNLTAAQVLTGDVNFEFALSNMKAITWSGAVIPLTGVSSSVLFKASDASALQSYNADQYKIYPNPVENTITVSAPGNRRPTHYAIYSVSGQLVDGGSLTTESINVAGMQKGYYFLKLSTTNGNIITKPFVKL